MNNTAHRPVYFLLFLIFIYFACFYQLDTYCLHDFDESRVAKSSYELSKTGELIIVKWYGQPDLWSTKPPLLNWIQAVFIKIMGLSELSVRLPSAIAGATILLFIYFFFKKNYQDIFLAYLIPIILGTSSAFFGTDHTFHTADYDAMLTLFLFLGSILFFIYLHLLPTKKTIIYLSFLFFACAVLTKGVAGFFLFPGIFLYVLISKKVSFLFKNLHFYLATLLFAIILFGFYYTREALLPGYIKAVNDMELLGRYNNTFINHSLDIDTWLNFRCLINERFSQYYLLIPFSLAIIPFTKNDFLRRIMLFSNILSFSLLGILCLAKSKNSWYDLPIIPFLSINAGISIMILRDILLSQQNWGLYFKKNFENIVILTYILIFGIIPTVIKIYEPPETKLPGYNYVMVIQNYIKQHRLQKNSTYLANLSQSQSFYFDMANEDGYNLKTGTIKDIKPGNIYFSAHKDIQEELESKFKFTLLDRYGEIKVYKILP